MLTGRVRAARGGRMLHARHCLQPHPKPNLKPNPPSHAHMQPAQPAAHPDRARGPAPTWKGSSKGRFCMTGRLKAAGACASRKSISTGTACGKPAPPLPAATTLSSMRPVQSAAGPAAPAGRKNCCCRDSRWGVVASWGSAAEGGGLSLCSKPGCSRPVTRLCLRAVGIPWPAPDPRQKGQGPKDRPHEGL